MKLNMGNPGHPVLVLDHDACIGESTIHITAMESVMMTDIAVRDRVDARVTVIVGEVLMDKRRTLSDRVVRMENFGQCLVLHFYRF
jgi:hypothetical protein